MADKASELAQAAAENLARRSFLQRFGRSAAVAASVLGGILMVPEDAQAGKRCYTSNQCPKGQWCGWDGRCHRPRRQK